MTIKFENHPLGYRIRLSGDRKKYIAKNVDEMVSALKHYYFKPHDKAICPLCRSD